MDEIKPIEEQPSEQARAKAPGWVWVALIGAVIISLGCGLVFGGAGGYLLGRKSSFVGTRYGVQPDCPLAGPNEMPHWRMPEEPRVPRLPRAPRAPVDPRIPEPPLLPGQPELRFEFPMMDGGAMVVEVIEGMPAELAGIEVGDVITAVDGESLEAEHSLADAIQEHRPGEEVTLTIARGTEIIAIDVRLAEHPERRGVGYLGVSAQQMPNMRGWERIVPQD